MSSLPILVFNSGSSSIKFSIYEAEGDRRDKLCEGAVDGIGTDLGEFWIKDAAGNKQVDRTTSVPHRAIGLQLITDTLQSGYPAPRAIGHRVVSGGPGVEENQPITPELIDRIERSVEFAPLHIPTAVHIMRESMRLFPGTPNFAILDTWFHRTLPEVAKRMPVAEEYAAMGVRRYGYHGISCESILHQLQPQLPEKLIVAHLGNGASITAIRNGDSIDTSMGLTPTGGIISATRTGDIDPGVLLFILRKIAKRDEDSRTAIDQLESAVDRNAGLLGVSELSSDMRALRQAIQNGNARARLAVDKFVWTIRKWIGSYFAELNGLDMLVFTGGIGENDSATRAEVCAGLEALGIRLDPARNQLRDQTVISAPTSPVDIRVLPPLEDLMIVDHVRRLLDASAQYDGAS